MGGIAARPPALPNESMVDNLIGMAAFLVDPMGASRRIFHQWFWIGPWILMSIVMIVSGCLTFTVIVLVLILSSAFRITKGKALFIVSPIVVLSLGFRLLGAAFSPS